MRPRKLTPERAAYVRTIISLRRLLPTHSELAKAEGVSKSLVDQIASGYCYKNVDTTNVHAILMALGINIPQTPENAPADQG